MNLNKLTQEAAQQASKQATILILSDEELKTATGGSAAIFCRCRYKTYSTKPVDVAAPEGSSL